MRLIDADALIEHCKRIVRMSWNNLAAPTSWAHAYQEFISELEDAPTIEVEPKWVPCSEGLPEVNKKVLVTYEKLNRGTLLVGFDKRVIRRGLEMWQGKGNSVLAWYDPPLPEPYKGDE